VPERIELHTGAAPWLWQAQTLLFVAAAVLLLTASTPWLWKSMSLLALLAVHVLALRHTRRAHPRCTLLLHPDGTLRLRYGNDEIDGCIADGAWLSPWLSVLRWTTGDGRRRSSLVCASENRRDEYRRLLVFLRLRGNPVRGIRS
jgi:hypothetical protein